MASNTQYGLYHATYFVILSGLSFHFHTGNAWLESLRGQLKSVWMN